MPPVTSSVVIGLYAVVAAGYVAAFILLTLVLKQGMGIGIAYGIWAACGVALTAVASKVFFSEPLTTVMMLGRTASRVALSVKLPAHCNAPEGSFCAHWRETFASKFWRPST